MRNHIHHRALALLLAGSATSAALGQIPGVETYTDQASGSTCNLINTANGAHLVVLEAIAEDPFRRFALVTGTDVTLSSSEIDDDLNVFFGDELFGRIAFLEDGDGLATLWWVDNFDNVIGLDSVTLDPFQTDDRPEDFQDVPCDACEFWDREEDCPGEPEITEIITQPLSGTVCAGENLTLFIEAVGVNIDGFQWFRGNDSIIVGATDVALVITSIDFDDAGSYYCEVIDLDGTRTVSDRATLVVEDCPDEPQNPGLQLCGANIFTSGFVSLLGLIALKPLARRRRRS
ncbi:MAG: immunoglobulin domain-containing protein [Phycisphaerales bacterium]|nr:immunoglobulin domain-containing protein [Phycisphaerales bacterium]